MNYYTIQIHYNVPVSNEWPKGVAIEERKDLHPGGLPDATWIAELRAKIYTGGITIALSPGNYELISPLKIHTVFILKQDKKFSP